MQRLTRYGGIVASIILIAFGIGAVYMGVDGRNYVRDNLAAEKIVGTPDSTIPNQKVDTGSEARAFADVMREHALEATGGRTYAQMEQDDPARETWVTETALSTALNMSYFAEQVALFSIVMGVALLLTGVGFGIVSLQLLRRREDEPATERARRTGAVAAH